MVILIMIVILILKIINFSKKKLNPARSKVKELCKILVLRRKFIPCTSIYVVAELGGNLTVILSILKKKRSEELVMHIQKAKKFLENTGRILLKQLKLKGRWHFGEIFTRCCSFISCFQIFTTSIQKDYYNSNFII